jgi:intracellular multiplication protein IcmX
MTSSILPNNTLTTPCNDALCTIANSLTQISSSDGNTQPTNLYPNTSKNNGSQAYLLNQIDSSFFLSPLIYGSDPPSNQTQSSSEGQGLSNNSQKDAASNYVKYVTGTLLPKSLATPSNISKKTTIIQTSNNPVERMQAFHDLLGYALGLRVYAAQISLPMQNFYESLAKRLDLQTASSSKQKTSQALNEFVMASYRLYTPSYSKDDGTTSTSAWQDMLNTASPATVQK